MTESRPKQPETQKGFFQYVNKNILHIGFAGLEILGKHPELLLSWGWDWGNPGDTSSIESLLLEASH